jgi:hypothetical protein
MRESVQDQIARYDWVEIASSLDRQGWALLPGLLEPPQCGSIAALYANEIGFRSQINMARHGFGRGAYRYFAYPLPPLVADLRARLYGQLAPIANRWQERLGLAPPFPADHSAFLERCHLAGQRRPTPLLLE